MSIEWKPNIENPEARLKSARDLHEVLQENSPTSSTRTIVLLGMDRPTVIKSDVTELKHVSTSSNLITLRVKNQYGEYSIRITPNSIIEVSENQITFYGADNEITKNICRDEIEIKPPFK